MEIMINVSFAMLFRRNSESPLNPARVLVLICQMSYTLANHVPVGGFRPFNARASRLYELAHVFIQKHGLKRAKYTRNIQSIKLMIDSGRARPLSKFNRGVLSKGGLSLSCLYPPLTQTSMSLIDKGREIYDKYGNLLENTINNDWDSYFRGTDYWDQYQSILKQYDVTAPSNWWSQITGQSQVNQYQHDMARYQSLQALLMQMKADEYNSPKQEVARNAEAGLNSDILGTDGVSQQADYGATGLQHPMMLSNPIDFLSMVGSAVSGAFGIVGQIQDMQTKSLMNDKERLAIHSLLNGISIETLVNGDYSQGDADISPAVSFGYNTGNPRLDKRIEKRTKDLMDSLPHQIATYKSMGDRAGARKNLFDITSSAGYTEDDSSFLGSLASSLAEIQLLTVELDQLEKQTNSLYQVSQDNWDMSYLSGLDSQTAADATNVQNDIQSKVDPVAAADAINSSNRETSRVNKLRSQIFNAEKGLINSLREAASNGNAFATAILFKLMSGQSTGISDGISAGANSAATFAKIAKMFVK